MEIHIKNNQAKVQEMLQMALLENFGSNLVITYYNSLVFKGRIRSFQYNAPSSGLPPLSSLSIFLDDDSIKELEITQIAKIEIK